MSREKTLVKNTLIMALGTFLPRIINLLTTPIITSATTDAQYGQLDLVTTTILSFIVPLCTLQIEQALFRFLVDAKSEKEQRRVITNGCNDFWTYGDCCDYLSVCANQHV